MKLSWGLFLLLAVAACSARRLPPGTPSPEYEAPIVQPWPPESGDAGADAAATAAPASAPAAHPAAVEPELSLDAGPR